MRFAQLLAQKNEDMSGAAPVTAAFLGDSVTHGCFECYIDKNGNVETVYERHNSYAEKFGRILSVLYPRAQLNIVNAGTSGGCAARGAERLERDVLRFAPDLVAVNFALNDCGAGDAGLSAYEEDLRSIFSRVRQSGAEAVLVTPNMMCTYVSNELADARLRAVAEDLAARTACGVLDRYVAAAKRAAADEGVPVADCYAVWKKMHANGVDVTALLANRLNHPSRQMQYLAALKLAELVLGVRA